MSAGKLLGLVAGLVVAAAFVVAPLLYGYRAPAVEQSVASGRGFLADVGTSVRGAVPQAVSGSPVAGNALAAVFVALAGIVLTVWLVKGARTGRGVTLTSIGWAVVALVLYLPGLAS